MASNRANIGSTFTMTNLGHTGGTKPPSGLPIWVSLKPSPDMVEELIRHFPEVVELLEEEIWTESKEWLAKGLVARSLGRRVFVEVVVHEFRLRARLKDDVAAFNLEDGFLIFRFKKVGECDAVLRPCSSNRAMATMFLPCGDGNPDRLGLGMAPAPFGRALGVGDISMDH